MIMLHILATANAVEEAQDMFKSKTSYSGQH